MVEMVTTIFKYLLALHSVEQWLGWLMMIMIEGNWAILIARSLHIYNVQIVDYIVSGLIGTCKSVSAASLEPSLVWWLFSLRWLWSSCALEFILTLLLRSCFWALDGHFSLFRTLILFQFYPLQLFIFFPLFCVFSLLLQLSSLLPTLLQNF